MVDHDNIMERDSKRDELVRNAIIQADTIILEASIGTEEQTNLLTVLTAQSLLARAFDSFSSVDVKLSEEFGETIANAVWAVESIINGGEEEPIVREALLGRVAIKFNEKAQNIFETRLLRWDFDKSGVI